MNTAIYTSKAGEQITLDELRLRLELIADDMDTAELIAREAGDVELAEALDGLFYEVDGLTPAPPAVKTNAG